MIRFNYISEKDFGLTVKDIQRDILPQFNNITYSKRGGDGLRFVKKSLGERTVKIEFHLKNAKTLEELQDKAQLLAEWFNVDQPCRLEFDDMPGRYLMAMPSSQMDLSQIYTYGTASIALTAFDPYYYSVDATELTLTGNGMLHNISTAPCAWELELVFSKPVERPEVYIGDIRLKFNANVTRTDVVAVNSNGVITINGKRNYNVISYLSKLGELKPGDSDYAIPDGATATFVFTSKFIR